MSITLTLIVIFTVVFLLALLFVPLYYLWAKDKASENEKAVEQPNQEEAIQESLETHDDHLV